jgi:transcriptional regulator GlxA family with amidase domain
VKTRIDTRVIHVIRLMEKHRATPWPVHRLARAVNVSPSHLTRLFRVHLGVSPAQYDKHARLANARDLILASFLSVKEIMAAVGWADASHFGREFKRRYGASPRALRKACAAERRAHASAPPSAHGESDRPTYQGRDRRQVVLSWKAK